jgi:hypothetical protein
MRDVRQPMPADWCARLELPVHSSLADGAQVFLDCLADQTSLPWPGGFPGNTSGIAGLQTFAPRQDS